MEGFNDGAGIQIIKPVETFTEKKGSISAYHPLELSISSLEPDDSTRKMSNDSGVSISTSRAGKDSPDSSIPNNSELIGEPKLSTLQNFLVQQSLALNPALMGLQSNPFSVHPWYPVWLSCVQQQQDTLNGKSNPVPKQIPKEMFNMPLYNPMMSFFPNSSIPSVPVPPASMEEVLKAQMAEFQKYQKSFSPSVDDQSEAKMTPAKPQSISDDETCPPHTRHSMSPLNISACPTSELQTTRKMSTFSADDRTCSSYQEDDDRHSVASGKSSIHSYDSKSPNSGHFSQCSDNQGKLQLSHNNGGRKESVRRRKIGVIGSSISDMGLSFLQSNLAPSHNQPSEKLSTASLPANLCSGRSGGSRKRPRTLPDDEKDEIYWERRRKNNEAAKRSRDSRRAKEDEIAIRAAFLEQENLRLRVEMAAMHQELSKIKHELSECQKKKNLDKESIHSSPDKEDVCHSPPASPSESS